LAILKIEIKALRDKHYKDIKSKDEEHKEFKGIVEDMKNIYNAQVEALVGENKELSSKISTVS